MKTYNATQASEILGVSQACVSQWIRTGKMSASKVNVSNDRKFQYSIADREIQRFLLCPEKREISVDEGRTFDNCAIDFLPHSLLTKLIT